MLGSRKLTALLGAAPDATAEDVVLKAYTKALQTEAGLALFLVVPGGKEPADCRTTQAKNKAIKEAEAAGEVKPTGLHMATTNPTHVARWITKYRKDRDPDTPVNIAMEVGRSRLILVDTDTPAEMDAFRQLWAEQSGDPNLAWVPPTVRSPGVFDEDTQTWIHKDGGHFYFTIPDGLELPTAPGSITMGPAGSQFTIYWRDRYVLIPPSRRKEGDYWAAGTDHDAPIWLLELIRQRGGEVLQRQAEREERRAKAVETGEVDSIEAWGVATAWSTILETAEWEFSGRTDSCTCEIWTRPGQPANKKSATVHGEGCSDPRFDPVNPPIHIWSDNISGGLADWVASHGKTLSKLQFIAAVFHDGDVSKAMAENGILPEGAIHGDAVSGSELAEDLGVGSSKSLADQMLEPDPAPTAKVKGCTACGDFFPEEEFSTTTTGERIHANPAGDGYHSAAAVIPDGEPVSGQDVVDMFANPGAPAERSETPPQAATDGPRRPDMRPFKFWRNLPPPEFIVDGWVEDRALSAFIGPSGVGKSAVVLDMACSIAMGIPWQGNKTIKSKVLYIAGEGASGAAARISAWESEHKMDVGEDLYMIGEAVLIGSRDKDLWSWMADQIKSADIKLVIFDTLARMSLGLEENSASDMGNAVARFDKLRREADCGVMVVHHTARGQSHGRGSSAILGALDSEVLVEEADDAEEREGLGKAITATTTKQKNARDGLKLSLSILERHGSIVVADEFGQTGDPLAGKVVEFDRTPAESDTELAIRLAEYLSDLPVQGASKTDMVRDVVPAKRLRRDKNGWKAAVTRAVDRGLATGLLATFGSDSSQRYVKGSATPAQALGLDNAEKQDREAQ